MAWAKRGTRSEQIRAEVGGAAAWARIRAAVIRRDQVCQWPVPSGRGVCGHPIDEVDHRLDRHDHRPESLWGLCSRHHRRKTAQEAAAARAAARRTPGRGN